MKRINMRMKYGTFFMADGDDTGGGGGDWRDNFGDDYKDNKGLADFKDLDGLAKAYLDTKADNGRSLRLPGPDATAESIEEFNTSLMAKVPGLTAIPGEDASDDMRSEFFRQLGRPTEASAYKMPDTEEANMKDGLLKLQEQAFKSGLNQKQYTALADSLMKDYTDNMNAYTEGQNDDYDKLKVDWGAGLTGKTQAILELAKATGAPESMIEAITGRTLDSDTMKWMDGMVSSLSGEGAQMNFQGDGHTEARLTPAEANMQIEEIMAKPEYWEQTSPLHAALVQKVVDLQSIALS